MVLHHTIWGPQSAAPVLAVHGVRNVGARFRRLAQEGLADCRVIAPDLRGHGDSTWDPPWNVATHVADLIDTLDANAINRTTVVGHSFGGLIAMHLAATHPDRVAQVALIDPAVALDPARCAPEAEADRIGTGRAEAFASVEDARAAWLSVRPVEGRWAVDEDLAAILRQDEDGRFRYRYSRCAAITAWSEMTLPGPSLARYLGRVVLITAMRDAFVSDTLRASLTADLGDRFTEIGIDAGHMLFWDAFEPLVAALRTVIASP